MRRIELISTKRRSGAALLLAVALVRAEGPDFAGLKKSYEEEVARTVQPLREGYRKALLTLQGQLAAKGDYAGAARVLEERLELERVSGLRPSTPAPRGPAVYAAGSGLLPGPPAEIGGGLLADGRGWTGWEKPGGFMKWTLPPGMAAGGYFLEISYRGGSGGSLALVMREDFHSLTRTLKPVAAGEEGKLRCGVLRIRPGAGVLELKVSAASGLGDFKVTGLQWVPAEEEP